MTTQVLPTLLTPREAAAALRVSVKTLRRLISRGDLTAVRVGSLPGASLRIRADELSRLLAGPDEQDAA